MRREGIGTLRRLGLDELVHEVDANLFGAAFDERVPEATQQQMGRMLELGTPIDCSDCSLSYRSRPRAWLGTDWALQSHCDSHS